MEVRNEFYKDAHGLLLVVDVTRRETFDNLTDLLQEIKCEVRSKISSQYEAEFFLI